MQARFTSANRRSSESFSERFSDPTRLISLPAGALTSKIKSVGNIPCYRFTDEKFFFPSQDENSRAAVFFLHHARQQHLQFEINGHDIP